MIDRAKQYSMSDATDRTKIGWRGRLNAVQHLWMEGRIMVRDATGGKVYIENLYDEDKGNLLVMHSETDCVVHDADTNAALPDEPTSPPVTSQEPGQGARPTAVAGSTAVLLFSEANGRRNFVDAMIGSLPIRMLLDTGATEMSVTDTAAHTLVDKREASWGANITTVMADNTTRDTRTILIDRVVIGGKIITNVRAYVAPDGSDMLLGMGVLVRFGKFRIDTVNGRLTLG